MTEIIWAVKVTGEFENTWGTYELPCPDETVARNRAAWWAGYRGDVTVAVVSSRDGQPWQVTA